MANPVHGGREIFDYLLGRLPPERMEEIEQRILRDDDFHLEVEASENDLLDQYVHNELAPEARRLFQKNFLTSELRRRKLQFALALKEKLEAEKAFSWTRINPYAYALAASVLVVLCSGIVNFRLARRLSQEEARLSTLNQQVEAARQQVGSGWSTQDAIVIAQLAPAGSRGGELAEVAIPTGVRGVQFVLQVPRDLQGKASVQLLSDAGQVITTISDLVPQDIGDKHVLIATLPVKSLPSANYFLQVLPNRPDAPRLRYSIKVREALN